MRLLASFLREHASWALTARLPRLDAIGRLVRVVVTGEFSGVLAQRTLAGWAASAPGQVALAIEGALAGATDPAVRSRLVETLGLASGPIAGRALLQLAVDPCEHPTVRLTAVAALGDRPTDAAAVALVGDLTTADGDLGAVARLAAIDLGIDAADRGVAAPGLTVAQLFLHADIDRDLSRAGAGDNGGVATLLVRLGDALATSPGVGRVLTLSRGSARAALDAPRLALDVAGIPYADVVLGHPSALPVGDEVYGYPPAWPVAFTAPECDLAALHGLCGDVRDAFTAEWNAALRVLAPGAMLSADAFAEHGDLLLLNYPAALHDPARTALLPPHAFLGSAVRAEPPHDDVRDWLAADDRPVVYVSFGSFLSARGDVLATVLEALRPLGMRVAVATGSATGLPDVSPDWLMRPTCRRSPCCTGRR